MTKVSVPATTPVRRPPLATLTEDHKKGYNFFRDRWEGDDSYDTARAVANYWISQGWSANVHEDTSKEWCTKTYKHVEMTWFRVYFFHPKEEILYAWWTPDSNEWFDEPKMNELTWFELKKPAVKK